MLHKPLVVGGTGPLILSVFEAIVRESKNITRPIDAADPTTEIIANANTRSNAHCMRFTI